MNRHGLKTRAARIVGTGWVVRPAFAVLALVIVVLARPAVGGEVPLAPESVAVYSILSQQLEVRWTAKGSAATSFKVQWKSGTQEYDASRQVVVSAIQTNRVGRGDRYRNVISDLVNGTEHSVWVIASNAGGDGSPSAETSGNPQLTFVQEEGRRFIEAEVVKAHESAFPWLRQTWNYLIDENVPLAFRRGSGGHVRPTCSRERGLHKCSIAEFGVRFSDYSRLDYVVIHELSHVYSLANGVASRPGPIGIAHLYFQQFTWLTATCGEPSELYADALTAATTEVLSGTYWLVCHLFGDGNVRGEAGALARSALRGDMPSWFAATYHDANGQPDLERLWTDVKAIEKFHPRAAIVHQLGSEFGGYCSRYKATDSAFDEGETRNPWRDGGCVPQPPSDLAATNSGNGELALSWKPPAYDGGLPIKYYSVKWKPRTERYDDSRSAIVTDLTNPSYTIPGLSAGVQYTVQVKAFNANGGGTPGELTWGTEAADSRAPELVAARVDRSTLALTYSELLDETSTPPASAFTVRAGSRDQGIARVSTSGNRLTLTLASAVAADDTVTVSYVAPTVAASRPIQDVAGNDAAGFLGRSVRNDTTAVTVVSDPGPDKTYAARKDWSRGPSEVTPETIELTVTFSESVTVTGVPRLKVNVGRLVEADYQGGSGTATLRFRYRVSEGDEAHEGLSVPAGAILTDAATIRYSADGVEAPARVELAAQPGHKVDAIRPDLVAGAAVVNGNTVTLTYDKVLDEGSVPSGFVKGSADGYRVYVVGRPHTTGSVSGSNVLTTLGYGYGGSKRVEIANVVVRGNTVTLTLATPVEANDEVQVRYAVPFYIRPPLRDTVGNLAGNIFPASKIANQTPPSVREFALTSNPGPDAAYGTGETIEVTATFDAAVTVDATGGTPSLGLRVGNLTRQAEYAGGSGTAALTVRYTVVGDDLDSDGPSIAEGKLSLNGGTIRRGDIDVSPAHPALAAQPDHRVDGVRPTLTGAAVEGDRLTLMWSEALDEGVTPNGSAFTVTVGGSARAVDNVSVKGSAVTLTLASSVSANDAVSVSYAVPADPEAPRIEDTAGNAAAGFHGETVNNNRRATGVPEIGGVARVGETLTVSTAGIGDENGLGDATFAYQWMSNDGTVDADIQGATEPGYTLAAADTGRTVKVRVTFTDGDGYEESLTSAPTASVTADAPVIVTVSPIVALQNRTAVATLGATDADNAPEELAWEIVGGADGGRFTLTTAGVLAFTAAKHSGSPDDADTDGNYEIVVRVTDGQHPVEAAFTIALQGADRVAPVLRSAAAVGTTLVLTWNEFLDESSEPAADAFEVTAGGAARGVTAVSVAGKEVTLTLDSSVTWGDAISVSYTVPADAAAPRIQDRAGNEAAAVSGRDVENLDTSALRRLAIGPVDDRNLWVFENPERDTFSLGFSARVDKLTVTPTPANDNAVIVFDPPTDADSARPGHQVGLFPGETFMSFTVTAPDGIRKKTYALKFGRGDTRPAMVEFARAAYRATEGVSAASVTVTVSEYPSAMPGGRVSIPLTATPAGGADAGDYTVAESVTFINGGPLSQTVEVTATADALDEDGESVVLGFGQLPGGVKQTGFTTATVSLVDSGVPEIVTASPILALENRTAVAVLDARDADSAAGNLAWEIVGGADRDKFTLSAGGVLTFTAAKDFEAPDDADSNGDYKVAVWVSDGSNTDEAALAVKLQDVDEVAPELVSATVDGAALTLTWSEALDEASEVATPAFAVRVAGARRGVVAVAAAGSAVTLTLASAVMSDEVVTVSYIVPTPTAAPRITDAAGNDAGSLSGEAVTNRTRPLANTPPTGVPRIIGTPRAHETLTASTADIADVDGLDGSTVSYQWIRSDGVADTDIDGATGASYRLASADVGRTIKVRVTFTDAGGTVETRSSAATASVASSVPEAPRYLVLVLKHEQERMLQASWAAPLSDGGRAITGYKVQWRKGSEEYDGSPGSGRQALVSNESALTKPLYSHPQNRGYARGYAIEELTNGVEYWVRVIAVNALGESAPSIEVPGTPLDVIIPKLLARTVEGASLVLTYDESLDEGSVPATSTFEVVVAGSSRGVTRVSVSGNEVTLTLASAVASGEEVRMSYTAPDRYALNPLLDLSGNRAPHLLNVTVAHGATARIRGQRGLSIPRRGFGIGEALDVTVTFTRYVFVDLSNGTPSLVVTVDGVTKRAAYHGGSGSAELTFRYTVGEGDWAPRGVGIPEDSLSLNGGSILDGGGNPALLTHRRWQVPSNYVFFRPVDGRRPELVGATVDGMALTIIFNEPLDVESVPETAAFTVTAGSARRDVAAVSVNGDRLTLTLDSAAPAGSEVRVSYAVPGETRAPRIRDAAGNSALGFTVDIPPEDLDATLSVLEVGLVGGFTHATSNPGTRQLYQFGGTGMITIAATPTHEDARVAFNPATDADETIPGHQIAYSPGLNVITITVTAGDGVLQKTYTLEVIRGGWLSATVEFGAAAYTATEGGTDAAVTVTLSEHPSTTEGASVTIPLTAAPGSGAHAADYTAPESVTFIKGGPLSQTVTVTAVDDAVDDDGEIVVLGFGKIPRSMEVARVPTATVSLEDNDAAPANGAVPVITTASPIRTPENRMAVATLEATDVDTSAAEFVWEIAGGADGQKFALTAGGVLAFVAAKDFEAPDDADGDGEYIVTARVSDGVNQAETTFKVRLLDVDEIAPEVVTGEVDGAKLALTYSEWLDADSAPAADAFTVTVGGTARAISNVWVFGRSVRLTLAAAVAAYDKVAVSYAVPADAAAGRIRDRAGNDAAGFTIAATVLATVPDAPHNVELTIPDGRERELAVSWTAPASNGGAAITGYKVQWKSGSQDYDETASSTRQTVVSGPTALTHTISGLSNGVEYTVRVVAVNGIGVGIPSAEAAGTPRDRVPPTVWAALVERESLTLTYDELLDKSSTPTANRFAVSVSGVARGVSDVVVSGNAVTLTLASAAPSSGTVNVSYIPPTDAAAPRIRDRAGNNALAFLGHAMRRNAIFGNTPPTGLPVVTGTPQVSERLWATVSGIRDADGMVGARFSFQWLSANESGESEIQGATGAGYTLRAADAGRTIKVRVFFTDDGGSEETLTSAPSAAVAAAPLVPSETTGTVLWSADMKVVDYGTGAIGAATVDLFSNLAGSGDFHVKWLWYYTPSRQLRLAVPGGLPDVEGLTLHLGDLEVAFPEGSGGESNFSLDDIDVDWTDGQILAVSIAQAPEVTVADAPGALTVATPDGREGELDVSWTAPASDGGSVVTSYKVQWKSGTEAYDGSASTTRQAVVSDSAARSYRITGLTVGTTYTVRVMAVNAAGDGAAAEATATAQDRAAPTLSAAAVNGAALTLTFGEVLDAASKPSADAFAVSVAGTARTVGEVALSGSVVELTLASAVMSGETVTVGYTVPTDANAAPLQDAAGNGVAEFTGQAVTNETPSTNTAPTGLPTFSGSAQVGEELTASTDRIADADGLDGVTFTYQWLANDGTDDTEIEDATKTTYEIAATDADKTLKVRVTFTDGGGTEETLTSAATAVVAARAPDAPGGLAAATADGREGELDVSWTAPASDGGAEVTGYKVQWKSGSEAWDGTAASTRQAVVSDPAVLSHTIAGLTVGTVYTVRVMAVNVAGDGAATETTAAARDRVVPALTVASVNGTALTLTFSEALDATSKPPADAFAVTVAGDARTVSEVALSGSAVELTLSSAVASGETVTVGYTAPAGADAAPLRDAAGNDAAGFNAEAVTNGTQGLPAVSIAAGTGPVTEGADAAFTLTRTGSATAALTVTVEVTESGAVLVEPSPVAVTFEAESATAAVELATADDEAVEDASTVTVTVVAGDGWTVDGDAGSAAVTVEDDDAAPEVTTASALSVAENTTAVVTLAASDTDTAVASLFWSIPAGTAGGADAGAFTLTGAGVLGFKASKDFEAPDDADGDGTYEVTVRVTDGANPVDVALMVTLTDVDEIAPTLVATSVNGTTLTLTFSEALDATSKPAAGAFAVTVEGTARDVSGVSLSESAGELTLASAVASGETVTVGYAVPTGADATPLKDAAGNAVAGFVGEAVTNDTPAPENTAPTGLPEISGTPRVGEVLTATPDAIADADGLDGVTFDYQWLANDGTDDTEIEGATGATHEVAPAEVGKTLKVRVTFIDGGGTEETLTSAATEAVVPTVLPEVSVRAGATYVKEGSDAVFTLTRSGPVAGALTATVAIEEGGTMLAETLPANAAFVAGAREAELQVPTVDDGRHESDSAVTVRVVAGTGYGPSADFASASVTVLDDDAAAPTSVPAAEALWSADMTVMEYTSVSIGAASADLFSNQGGSAGLQAKQLWYHTTGRTLRLSFTSAIPDSEGLTLHLGARTLAVPAGSGGELNVTWTGVDIDWTDGQTLAVRLTAQSEDTAPADASLKSLTVSDVELSPGFDPGELVYRAVVGSGIESVTVSAAANDDSATLAFEPAADADNGKSDHQVTLPFGETLIAVTVTAEDGETQRRYRVVAIRTPPAVTVSFGSASYTATEGGSPAEVAVALSGDPGREVTIPLTAVSGGGATAEDYTAPAGVTFTSGGALTQTVTVTAAKDDVAETGESVVLGFGELPEGIEAGATTSATVALEDAVNASPTGLPVITGTPRVGEGLTASTDGIADADGLTGATYAYQWLANDGTEDTEIEGATGTTHEVAPAQVGKTLKVRVTFTDGGGTEETLTSAATVPVAARAPDAPGGLTVTTAAGREGELDVSWTAPESDGGSEVTGYKVQWKSGAEAWDGTASSTRQAVVSDPAVLSHRIAGLTVGTAYTVRVMAVNAAGDGAAAEVEATAQDRVVPALAGATVNGTTLTLTFSEALDATSKPAADAFAVTVAGTARTVDAVALSGSAVELTLASGVASGETVTVGYAAPAGADAALLKDAAGNPAAGFSAEAVTNGTQGLPAVSIAAETIPVTEGADAAFTLTRTGSVSLALTVTVEVMESGAVLTETSPSAVTFQAESATAALELATGDDEAVEDASTVTVTVVAGDGWTVDSDAGSAAVTVEDDDASPEVTTASALSVVENATAVVTLAASDTDTDVASLVWSIPAGIEGGADAGAFTLTEEGALSFQAAKDFEAPDDADGDGTYEVTVRVTDGANPVDAALKVSLADVDEVAPVLAAASVNGTALTLTFSEALDAASKPPADAFAVTVAGAARTVAEVALSGSSVTLTLGSAAVSGETVTVGYTVPTGANAAPLKDAAGNAVASFSGEAVTNETLASANQATPPGQPRIIGIYADESKLRLRWVQYGGDGGLPVIGYKVQWKSGEQEYGPSRQAVVSVAEYTIEGLTDGVEYIVRVIATNAIGDSLPSWENYAMPGSPEESMLNHIENEIVEKYGDSFPWLRASWARMNQPGFDFSIIESGGWFGAAVQASCSSRDASYNYFDYCSVDSLTLRRNSSEYTILHELAHIASMSNRLVSNTVPYVISLLYVDSLICPRPSVELLADLMASQVRGSTERTGYWSNCFGPNDSTTQEALAVIGSTVRGEMPSWFADTYHDAEGIPDLERLWADVDALSYNRAWAVYALRNEFGGYCDKVRERPLDFLRSGGIRETKNPWKDDGCVPGAPRTPAASAGDGKLWVTWEAPGSSGALTVTEYILQWKSGSQEYAETRQAIVTDAADHVSHTISGLDNDTEYTLRVRAQHHVGMGDWSDEVTLAPAAVDSTPPVFQAASVPTDGATLTLTYNETLDETSVPAPGTFTVSAGGVSDAVDGVSVGGKAVTLTLGSAVEQGGIVTVSYAAPAQSDAPRIQDAAGNEAAGLAGATVSNHALPVVSVTADFDVATPYLDDIVFTLTRTGTATEVLEVDLSLSQTEVYYQSLVLNAAERKAIFPAGSRTATVKLGVSFSGTRPTNDGTLTATLESGDGYLVGDGAAATVKLISRAIEVRPEASAFKIDEGAGDLVVTVTARTLPGVPKPRSNFYASLYAKGHIPPPPDLDPRAVSGRDYRRNYEFPPFTPSDFVADGDAFVARKEMTVLSIIEDRLTEGPETIKLVPWVKNSKGRNYSIIRGAFSWYHPDGTSCSTSDSSNICSFSVTIVDNDETPVITTPSRIAVAAGETAVATLTATVSESDSPDFRWFISNSKKRGADSEQFTLTWEGVLAFKEAKDSEAPDDADADGNYEVTVTVGDYNNVQLYVPVWGKATLVVALEGADRFPPTLEGATVDGTTVVLSWSELMDETSTPSAGAFAVAAGGTAYEVVDVSVAGRTVTLTLAAAVAVGEAATVSYMPPAGASAAPLRDAAGNDAAAFSGPVCSEHGRSEHGRCAGDHEHRTVHGGRGGDGGGGARSNGRGHAGGGPGVVDCGRCRRERVHAERGGRAQLQGGQGLRGSR